MTTQRPGWHIKLGYAIAALALAQAILHHGDGSQLAYVGPGAGFAFLGSFLSLIAGFLLGLFSFLPGRFGSPGC